MSPEYRDRWIRCTDKHVAIRGYYFPWGTKRIPYDTIRGVPLRTRGWCSTSGRWSGR